MYKVKVVNDRKFRGDVRFELKKALQEFKRQFGVDFEISEISEWKSIGPSLSSLFDLLPFPIRPKAFNMLFNLLMWDLQRKVKANGEIVVGFTGKISSQCKPTFGMADGNYVLVGDCQIPYSYVILHEIGHVFGADDRPDFSVMRERGFSYTYDFSVQDREIIIRSLTRSSKES